MKAQTREYKRLSINEKINLKMKYANINYFKAWLISTKIGRKIINNTNQH